MYALSAKLRLVFGAALPPVSSVADGPYAIHQARIHFGLQHLPGALLWIAVATVAALVAYRTLSRPRTPLKISTPLALGLVVATYLAIWLPAWWAGGFAMDDWRLLAAASIRKLIYAHPLLSLHALDTVDGNFRPLGTVLYYGYMLRWFGVSPHVFTLGPMLLILLSVLAVYVIVRELGYSRGTAVMGAALYGSRGILYTVVTWPAALGDGISLSLCGFSSAALLRATRQRGTSAFALYALAWVLFAVASLGKQSAFVMPLIAAAILLLRPGKDAPSPPWRRRVAESAAVLVVYGATAVLVFLHAKNLLHWPSPYKIAFSPAAVWHLLAYVTWYFGILQLPPRWQYGDLPAELIGALLLVLCALAALRWHQRFTRRARRNLVFALLAAAISLSLFAVLQTRAAPYYGCMSAFWISVGMAIFLAPVSTAGGEMVSRRAAAAIVVLLVWSGACEVRLEQTALIPSGGYVWGAFGAAADAADRADLHQKLASVGSGVNTVIFTGCADRLTLPAMMLLDAPGVERILIAGEGNTVFVNDREGLRPADDLAGLTDPGAYGWNYVLPPEAATRVLQQARDSGTLAELSCPSGIGAD